MSNLTDFLRSLGNGVDDFNVITHEGESDYSDTSKIFSMQQKGDFKGLFNLWQEKVRSNQFELVHPETGVKTTAVYNVNYGVVNFVFMADENNNNVWLLAQSALMINLAITIENIYRSVFSNEKPIFPHIKNLSSINASEISLKKGGFGFLLSHPRPYHHFYDQLKVLTALDHDKPVLDRGSFFIPEELSKVEPGDHVFLYPNAINSLHIKGGGVSFSREKDKLMERLVYKESIRLNGQGFSKWESGGSVCLWFGVTGQKRSWLEQVEGCICIVKLLKSYFDTVSLYVDGMTAIQGKRIKNEEDEAVFQEIRKGLLDIEGIVINSLIGLDYREKIRYCDSVDLFIANAGTGCMVPLRFARKPGVLHSNTKLFSFPDEYPSSVKKVGRNYVVDVFDSDSSSSAQNISYHVPWQHIFNLASDVLSEIKDMEIPKLDVPPVESLDKNSFNNFQKKHGSGSQHFFHISGRLGKNPNSPAVLREVALAFEAEGDIQTAMKVMEKAYVLRPNGPIIKKKLEEYKSILKIE